MESYEDFIQTQLSRLDGTGVEQKRESPRHGPSVIRFHGVPILPPLLTAERRAEMLTYRSEAVESVERRSESALGRRMSQLNELLDSVQLWKAPTLQEFIGGQSPVGGPGGGASEEEAGPEEAGSLAPGRPRASDEEPFPRPLTSTARGSLAAGELPELHSLAAAAAGDVWGPRGEGGASRAAASECRLATEEMGADVSHRSASSGYATHDNTEASPEGHTEVTEGHGGVIKSNPEVIKIHAEVMESHAGVMEGRAGVTAVHTEVAAGVMAGHRLNVGGGKGEEERGRKGGGEEEGTGQTEAESFFLHRTLGRGPEGLDGLQGDGLPGDGEAGGGAGAAVFGPAGAGLDPAGAGLDPAGAGLDPVAGPPRLSLQVLLKRSQEYRQRQRQLRGARALCRSDKENQPGSGSAPLRRARGDRRPAPARLGPVGATAGGGARSLEPGGTERGSGDRKPSPGEEQDASLSRPGPVEPPEPRSTEIPAPPPAPEAPPPGPPPQFRRGFGPVPGPRFCSSPIPCKRTGRPARRLPVNTALSASAGHRGRQSVGAEEEGGAEPVGGGGGEGAELELLETNLSSLRALITDLQATLTDTPGEGSTPAPAPAPAPNPAPTAGPASQHAERSERTRPRSVPSLAQRRRVPDLFRTVPGAGVRQGPVLCDASNQLSAVETPSSLWPLGGVRGPVSAPGDKPLSSEEGGHGQDSRAKRRLLMNTGTREETWTLYSTPKGCTSVLGGELQTLVVTQQLQLQELLQRLSLQGVSVLGPSPSPCSGVKGVVTCFPLEPRPLLQRPCSSGPLPPAWRPLLAAAVKGYLTRRLLRTERLEQLRRTVKDSQQVLRALLAQTSGRGDLGSRQDLLLQERVLLQLRSARYEVHDIFLSFSPSERMQLISWDRELIRERELRSKENGRTQSGGRVSLSAATVKALERKRSVGFQKRAAERQRGSVGGACGARVRRLPHGERRATLSGGGNP